MTDEQLQAVRAKVKAPGWSDMALAIHNASVTMGIFGEPQDESLVGLTLGQWQEERARRMALAAIDYITGYLASQEAQRRD